MNTKNRILPFLLCLLLLMMSTVGLTAAARNESLLGDVNDDDKITSADARLALRAAARLENSGTFIEKNADIDGDGKITSTDARQILCYVAKIITVITDKPTTRPTTTAPPTTRDPLTYKIAMIGDSLVATLAGYNVNSNRIDYYGRVSLNVNTIFTKSVQGRTLPIIDEVKGKGYDKIIIHLGVNEVDYDNTYWKAHYAQVVDGVKQRAPGAQIYCDAILPISAAASAKNNFGCNNAAINRKNAIIKQVAEEKGAHFVDAGVILRNGDGVLPPGAASDGIHLNYNYCVTWTNWLLKEICK